MNWLQKIKMALADPIIRRRMLFTVAILFLFRLLSAIPVPGIDPQALSRFFSDTEFLSFLNIFSGGGLSTLSIVMLGVGPYITASIVMQLLTVLSPKLKAMYQEEGELGRKKFAQYSRLLTIPLAIVQAFAFIVILRNKAVIPDLSMFGIVTNVVIITAGSMLLMWLGELVTEFGIGNGVSLIIFAGIVAQIPSGASQMWFQYFYPTVDPAAVPMLIGLVVAALLIIYGVVVVTEAERPIPVTYAKRIRGQKVYGGSSTYLPLRINQAGVIPIIFALSLVVIPQMLFRAVSNIPNDIAHSVGITLYDLFSNPWFYSAVYFILVFFFTYFYTAVTFDPESLSNNLQKSGAFIPGVRPGHSTAEYVSKVLTRITLVGAVFLGIIAVLPLATRAITGNTAFAIGGTALLIVVSVVLDLIKKIDAQISMREY